MAELVVVVSEVKGMIAELEGTSEHGLVEPGAMTEVGLGELVRAEEVEPLVDSAVDFFFLVRDRISDISSCCTVLVLLYVLTPSRLR